MKPELKQQMKSELLKTERKFYIRALAMSKFQPDVAAKLLGVGRSTFFKKLKALKIKYRSVFKFD